MKVEQLVGKLEFLVNLNGADAHAPIGSRARVMLQAAHAPVQGGDFTIR